MSIFRKKTFLKNDKMEFKELGVSEPILKTLEEQNIKEPTEIQRKTIPLILKGNDIIAGSATGSDRVLRGGDFNAYAQSARSAHRILRVPSRRCSGIGFRLLRTP